MPARSGVQDQDSETLVFCHQEAGQRGLLFGFLFLLAAEGLALHLLLDSWKPWVAWLVTSSNIASAVWLLREYRLTAGSPHRLTPAMFHLRAGSSWRADIPRESIQAVAAEPPRTERRKVSTSFLASPTHWLLLDPPADLIGSFGMRKTAAAVGLTPDDPAVLNRLTAQDETTKD